MPFGKHKDECLGAIPRGYLEFMSSVLDPGKGPALDHIQAYLIGPPAGDPDKNPVKPPNTPGESSSPFDSSPF